MSNRFESLKSRVLMSTSAAALGLALTTTFGSVALAQDTGADQGATIVVTGSRIVRRDYTAASPIVTLQSEAFDSTANIAIEATLNKLPQFTPTASLMGVGPGGSGDIQPTAVNSVGASTAALRGLGANRNVVLVDGRRPMPINGLGIVDLNSIPTAMIDRVEIISGGASAVYGADAVTGVVNFILKKNFQGLDFDTQYGMAEAGGDREFKASALIGANFADDRGNVALGVEHFTRGETLYKDRKFFQDGYNDPSVPSNAFFLSGSFYGATAGDGGCPTNVTTLVPPPSIFASSCIPGLLNVGLTNPANTANGTGIYLNPVALGVGAYGGANFTPVPGLAAAKGFTTQTVYDNFDFANGSDTEYTLPKVNWMDRNLLLSPITRWSAFSQAHFDINEYVTAFLNASFVSTKVTTTQIPTPFINGWGVLIPYDTATAGVASGHPVPANLASLLDNRTIPFAGPDGVLGTADDSAPADSPWQLNLIPNPNSSWAGLRGADTTNNTWQVQFGLNGKLPISDWTWETYALHGQTTSYSDNFGNYSLERYRAILLSPNYGAGAVITGNTNPVTSPGPAFGASTGRCTSGFYDTIFNDGSPSQDCIDAISAPLQSQTILEMNHAEVNVQGRLFDLPAGELRFALGADYRENYLKFNPDQLQSNFSWNDQVAGLYPAGFSEGNQSVKEGYGELRVPVLKDLPLVKDFTLDLGARYSSYDIGGNGWTYKVLGEYHPFDWLFIRGGYNRAVRAPSVGEAYFAFTQNFASSALTGDPCSLLSTAPWGVGGADNTQLAIANGAGTTSPVINSGGAAGAASSLAICQGLMGDTDGNIYTYAAGTGSSAFYGRSQAATAAEVFGFDNYVGNDKLTPEKADTWTAGVVVNSPIDSPWLSRASLVADFYSIKIADAIAFRSGDYAKFLCYGQTVPVNVGTGAVDNAALAAALASEDCQNVLRIQGAGATGGGQDRLVRPYDNLGTLWTSGIDLQASWGMDFADMGLNAVPGSFNISAQANVLLKKNSKGSAVEPIIQWKGTTGPVSFQDLQPGSPDWRVSSTFTYLVGPLSASLRWSHTPSVNSSGAAIQDAWWAYGGVLVQNTIQETNSHDEFDLYGNYALTDRVTFRAGINNLLDAEPEISGAAGANIVNPTTGHVGYVSPVTGTILDAGAFPTFPSSGKGNTNATSYDAIGRRFFIGVNVKF